MRLHSSGIQTPNRTALAEQSFKRDLPVAPVRFDQFDQNVCAGKPHIFNRLHERGQRRQQVFREFQTVDGDDGAILRYMPSVIAESLMAAIAMRSAIAKMAVNE